MQICILKTIPTHGCVENLHPCSYQLTATDDNALGVIDTHPAVSMDEAVIVLTSNSVVSTCSDVSQTAALKLTETTSAQGLCALAIQ